ncbi:DNA translocase FtsK [Pseudorhodobacter sp. MZDSW-24AT]|uniref:DNA translocase FtsK n=1 Tax=Pseudorhodobacter sp. MZDSW-24AT TaxID=2052957 RepID=UPI000C1E6B33|nr:DNA translocase FtsK [Pseudorhodobacter sp. MZDSW-24AT]PJF09630.1 cell division protein FtsK [Pseudorhodobacter sp. MZDSW-24AT]
MASINMRQRDPLLDQDTAAMLERRGRELVGIALLLVAVLFAAMLGSYSPEDPGWMVATDEPAANMLGRFGAAVSSTLMIIGGKGAWMLPVILGVWGLRFVTHRGAERAMGRIVFAVIAVALASVFAATLVPGSDWPHSFGLGGLFGDTILGTLLGVAPVSAGVGLTLFSLILGGLLLVMGLWVTGFTMVELSVIGRFLAMGSIFAYGAALNMAGRGTSRAAHALAERRAVRAEAMAHRAATRSQAWDEGEAPPAYPRTAAPAAKAFAPMAARNAAIHRAAAAPPAPEPEDTAAQAQEWGRPSALRSPLRADPRYPEPMAEAAHYAPPREKAGILARMPQLMRRAEPEPELVEPVLPEFTDAQAPSDDRIKARISDAIRSRMRHPGPVLNPGSTAQTRREPPVARSLTQRLRGPQPLIADTRRSVTPPPVMAPAGLPPEPPLTAAQVVPLMAPQAAARFAGAAVPPTAPLGATSGMGLPPAPPLPRAYRAEEEPEAFGDSAQAWDDVNNIFTPDLPPVPPYADDAEADEAWQPDDNYEPDYDPTPVMAPRAPRVAPHIPVPEVRKPVVQHVVKKPVAPSRQAIAESHPRLRFDEQVNQPYELPPLSLLSSPSTVERFALSDEALEENARMLESVLDDYGVKGEIVSVRPGPVVTMYELEPAPGLKASRVIGLADDIARSMSALSARVSTVPGRSVIGIELPNATREKVVLREIIAARDFGDSNMRLPLALGKDIGGDAIVANLAKMPHLLIAGTTGSGKSVAINTMILSLLYKLSPEECRLIMIDPKMLELSVYDGIPHLLSPVVTDPKKAVVALKWVVGEMEERYRKMSKMGVRNIEGYNGRVREALAKGEMFKRTIQTGFDEDTGEPVFETEEFAPVALPYIVVIVDEMADLMMVAGKEIEACIQRLAQMARASGIHLIMATQRPSVDVITGTIKANFPTRISFQVTSKIDSRTILGEQGAEQLLGMGDMLYMGNGAKITRIHGPFVSDEEVEEIVNHLKSFGPPVYMSGVVEGPDEDTASDIDVVLGLSSGEGGGDDALYDQAVAIVAKDRKCSTSYIQRKLGIGYNKAAKLVEQMEEQGVVTAANHVGKREILVPET